MSFSTASLLQKQIISTGAATSIALPFPPTGVKVYDITKINANAINNYRWAWWKAPMTNGSAVIGTSNAGNTDVLETIVGTNGISIVDTSQPNLGAAVVGTAISQAAAAVVTSAAHPFVVGDIVQLTNTTGMLQIAGMDFTITATAAGNYTLGNLNTLLANGFTAPGTAATARKVGNQPYYYPRRRFITEVSNAVNARVTMSVTHGYTVGQKVRIIVPAAFGMTQINGLVGTITAIGNLDAAGVSTNTIDLDINSSAFSNFAFPASFVNYFGQFAEVVPIGDDTPTLAGATINTASFLVTLGTSVVGSNLDVLDVQFERATLI